ncbi:hypothetical protein VP01_3942g1 [Puccinia sorghi]|uniref:Uncharacterized protein n=1 Tax=Puccinia sorghi TaxID=27349 RepID=A0A0L6UTB4_9BASI|nr:hypothetical protein VP01_3942g1 [Puccinia sorghi]
MLPIIENITRQIESLKSNSKKGASTSRSQPAQGKKAASTSNAKTTQTSTTSAPKKKSPEEKTPQIGQRTTSSPPQTWIYTNKGHIFLFSPIEYQSVTDIIAYFFPTSLFSPHNPSSAPLKNFTSDFAEPNKLKMQSKVAESAIGQVKCGNSIIHLGSRFVTYAQGLMSQSDLRVWFPNLDKDSSSLYGFAHSGFHFLHYLQLDKYKKDSKEKGKVSQEANNKKISKNRERVWMNFMNFLFYTSSRNAIKKFWNQSLRTVMTILYQAKTQQSKPLAKTSGLRVRRFKENRDVHLQAFPDACPLTSIIQNGTTLSYLRCRNPYPTKMFFLFFQMQKSLYDQNLKDTRMKNWPIQPSPRNIGRSWQSHMAFDSDEKGQGIDLTQPSPDASKDEFLEEGDAGSLYNDKNNNDFIALDDEDEVEEGD